MKNRLAIFALCAVVLLVGPAANAQADTATQLPFPNESAAWLTVDPAGGHVFVSGGPGTSSIEVLNYAGNVVKTITGEGGASQMALDSSTHTLYVALHDSTSISEIDTQTLTETKRFATAPYAGPGNLVIAGGKLWFSCDNSGGCLVSANLDGSGMASPISGVAYEVFLAAGGTNHHLLAFGYSAIEPPIFRVYDVSGTAPTLVSGANDPNGNSGGVHDMTFDPSGANLLLATGAPSFIQSLATSNLLPSGDYPIGSYPVAVAVTADGKYVAGAVYTYTDPGADNVFVYPAGSTTPLRSWKLGTGAASVLPHSLAFSPDGSRLFALTNDPATGHLAFDVLSRPTVRLAVTSTSLARSKATVHYGSHTTLVTRVNGTTSGKVDLYATPVGGTQKHVATGTVNSGKATFTVIPKQNTTYSAQLEQGSGWASSTSQNVNVAVAPITSVTARAHGKVLLRGHRVSRTLLTARVKPARPNEPLGFLVQRKRGGAWRTVARGAYATGSDGTALAFFFTNIPGKCRVRAIYGGDTFYAPSLSGWKKFRVRKIR